MFSNLQVCNYLYVQLSRYYSINERFVEKLILQNVAKENISRKTFLARRSFTGWDGWGSKAILCRVANAMIKKFKNWYSWLFSVPFKIETIHFKDWPKQICKKLFQRQTNHCYLEISGSGSFVPIYLDCSLCALIFCCKIGNRIFLFYFIFNCISIVVNNFFKLCGIANKGYCFSSFTQS